MGGWTAPVNLPVITRICTTTRIELPPIMEIPFVPLYAPGKSVRAQQRRQQLLRVMSSYASVVASGIPRVLLEATTPYRGEIQCEEAIAVHGMGDKGRKPRIAAKFPSHQTSTLTSSTESLSSTFSRSVPKQSYWADRRRSLPASVKSSTEELTSFRAKGGDPGTKSPSPLSTWSPFRASRFVPKMDVGTVVESQHLIGDRLFTRKTVTLAGDDKTAARPKVSKKGYEDNALMSDSTTCSSRTSGSPSITASNIWDYDNEFSRLPSPTHRWNHRGLPFSLAKPTKRLGQMLEKNCFVPAPESRLSSSGSNFATSNERLRRHRQKTYSKPSIPVAKRVTSMQQRYETFFPLQNSTISPVASTSAFVPWGHETGPQTLTQPAITGAADESQAFLGKKPDTVHESHSKPIGSDSERSSEASTLLFPYSFRKVPESSTESPYMMPRRRRNAFDTNTTATRSSTSFIGSSNASRKRVQALCDQLSYSRRNCFGKFARGRKYHRCINWLRSKFGLSQSTQSVRLRELRKICEKLNALSPGGYTDTKLPLPHVLAMRWWQAADKLSNSRTDKSFMTYLCDNIGVYRTRGGPRAMRDYKAAMEYLLKALARNNPNLLQATDAEGNNLLHHCFYGPWRNAALYDLLTSLEVSSKQKNAQDISPEALMHYYLRQAIARARTKREKLRLEGNDKAEAIEALNRDIEDYEAELRSCNWDSDVADYDDAIRAFLGRPTDRRTRMSRQWQ